MTAHIDNLKQIVTLINFATPPLLLVSSPSMGTPGLVLCALATTMTLLWMMIEPRQVRK